MWFIKLSEKDVDDKLYYTNSWKHCNEGPYFPN